MADLSWPSETQMRRIEPYIPLSQGMPRVDDRRVLSGIVFVIRNGLRWRDAPADCGPPKPICNRFIRWSRLGVFNKIFAELAGKGPKPERLMIDATHLKAHRTAASLQKRGCSPTYRAHQRRAELQTSRRLRWPGPHPFKDQSQGPDPPRRRPLPTAPQDRDHVRTPQGLAAHPHALRPLRP